MSHRVFSSNPVRNHIFTFLDCGYDTARCSRVAKSWRQSAITRWGNVRELDFRELFASKVPKKVVLALTYLFRRCSKLNSVIGPKARGDSVTMFNALFLLLPKRITEFNLLPAYPCNPVVMLNRLHLTPPVTRVTNLSLPSSYEDTLDIVTHFPEVTQLRIFGEASLVQLLGDLELQSLEVMGPFAGNLLQEDQAVVDEVNPCPSLTQLSISGCRIEERMIHFLAQTLPSLVSLRLESCFGPRESELFNQLRPKDQQNTIKVDLQIKKNAAAELQRIIKK